MVPENRLYVTKSPILKLTTVTFLSLLPKQGISLALLTETAMEVNQVVRASMISFGDIRRDQGYQQDPQGNSILCHCKNATQHHWPAELRVPGPLPPEGQQLSR